MTIDQRSDSLHPHALDADAPPHSDDQREPTQRTVNSTHRRAQMVVLALLLLITLSIGGSSISPADLRQGGMAAIVAPWTFNLLTWEVDALWQKIRAFAQQPAHGLSNSASVALVHVYLDRAQEIAQIESEIGQLFSRNDSETVARVQPLQQRLEALRNEQQAKRSTVEQIIETQVAYELNNVGMDLLGHPFPPVQFTFVEPPRKLVVSPRDQITTIYSRMLDATMSLASIEAAEATYREVYNSSAYITNIGGLGAFPTMVIDQAGLEWILSTVAHEWTHNYLTLFPLGINYMTSPDFITMNETVAEIVGNEVGEATLRTFYPELVPPPEEALPAEMAESERIPPPDEPERFDFRREMRQTRLVVDQLLALGKVEDAEAYMEVQRLYFVENGYSLRLLNQAYFAFHGSYGTSAASTSPIGPKMEALRSATPNLKTFLETVRSFTSTTDLDRALAEQP